MGMLVALLSLLLTVHIEGNSEGPHWSYSEIARDKDGWAKDFPKCGGSHQSPINIQTKSISVNKHLKPLELNYYSFQEGEFLLVNNGHTVQCSLPSSMNIIEGLPYLYTAIQLHFHWGGKTEDSHGSEHTINGVRFDSELHIVHYNSDKYNSYEEAKDKPDGLAVIAVLLKAKDKQTNPHYENFLSQLSKIQNVGDSVTLDSIDVEHMLPPNYSRYYRYNGSLTTPPCTENVIWTVLAEPVTISTEQLKKLQNSLLDNDHETLQNNFREVKPLNQRKVEANFSLQKRGKESGSANSSPSRPYRPHSFEEWNLYRGSYVRPSHHY
ncbi:carbonic anhydrase 6 isoform X2 [Dromiciops gliroides]|nr:carbonic anhydrase 6 isoform X2 [Dromiciops gliroides]XP_043852739.1 carbonic anhydrase 6 isoform X2 [Dromiciops gliroides]XP_043852740.1 carbonic anhydrase 6 isoform X2 [Dromiciops gliroides]